MTTYAGLYGPEALIDGTGHPITSATIDVFTHGTTTHVSLYQDNARVTPLTNPVPNGADGSTAGRGLDTFGNLSFYVDPGRYDLRIATGAGTRTVEIEIETDPAESAASVLSDKGNWTTATVYAVGDVVTNSNQRYAANVAHTAGATFAGDAAKWTSLDPGPLAPLSNATPQPLGAVASPGTSPNALRADAVFASPPGTAFMFGDGSDGSLTFDGSSAVTNFSRSGSVYTHSGNSPVYAANVTINNGVTVNMNTCILYVSGTLTNNGTLTAGQKNAAGATGGSVGFLGTPQVGAGGDGGAGATGNGAAGAVAQASGKSFNAGGAGGAGGTGSAGAGGASGGVTNDARFSLTHAPLTAFTGQTSWVTGGGRLGGGSGGGGGGGDGTNAGGGGGSGGNTLVANVRTLVNNGAINADGGNGANGVAGNAGGGGGGAGGFCYVNTTVSSGSGTVTAAGGTPGSGVGTGAAGSTGGAGLALLTVWA